MPTELETALTNRLIAMADDELILGHRDSEWCGRAPILEEDIAFANLALDEIGHARVWYGLAATLLGEDPALYPDRLVYRRPAGQYTNLQMVELPNGDWAFSMLRQFLFDAAEGVRLAKLVQGQYIPMAEAAAKIQKEELYHYRHTLAWVQRLSLGTEESHQRMQKALDELWPYTSQLWQVLPGEEGLVEAGYLPDHSQLERAWLDRVIPVLRNGELEIHEPDQAALPPSRREHTLHLEALVDEMQSLVRLDPQAEW